MNLDDYLKKLKDQLDEEIVVFPEKSEVKEPFSFEEDKLNILNDAELKKLFINRFTLLIKEACQEIIYEFFPIQEQLNMALEPIKNKEKIQNFIIYRDNLQKQCEFFIEKLNTFSYSRKEMVILLKNLEKYLKQKRHKQTILINLGFKEFRYEYDFNNIMENYHAEN